jgi:hypothetical protein
MAPVAGLRATVTPDPRESCPTARHCVLDAHATPDMKMPEMLWSSRPLRTIAVSGLSGTAMPLVSLGFSPTARQVEPDGQLTPLRNPLDLISWSDCPVERPPDTGSKGAAAPELTLDTAFPTPMHWRAEAQATPLKVVIGVKSRAMAPADVTKRVAPDARSTRVIASVNKPIRTARVRLFIITW